MRVFIHKVWDNYLYIWCTVIQELLKLVILCSNNLDNDTNIWEINIVPFVLFILKGASCTWLRHIFDNYAIWQLCCVKNWVQSSEIHTSLPLWSTNWCMLLVVSDGGEKRGCPNTAFKLLPGGSWVVKRDVRRSRKEYSSIKRVKILAGSVFNRYLCKNTRTPALIQYDSHVNAWLVTVVCILCILKHHHLVSIQSNCRIVIICNVYYIVSFVTRVHLCALMADK